MGRCPCGLAVRAKCVLTEPSLLNTCQCRQLPTAEAPMVCIATVTWPRLSGAAAPLMIDQKRRNETVAAARQANQQARAGRKSKLVNSRPGQVCLPFPPPARGFMLTDPATAVARCRREVVGLPPEATAAAAAAAAAAEARRMRTAPQMRPRMVAAAPPCRPPPRRAHPSGSVASAAESAACEDPLAWRAGSRLRNKCACPN